MELKKLILKIVTDYSGGIKFTELLTEIMKYHYDKEKIKEDIVPDMVMNTIYDIPELKVLEYQYVPIKRLKYFIYTSS